MSCFKDNRLIEVFCVLVATFIMISLMIEYPYQTDNDDEDGIDFQNMNSWSYNTSNGLIIGLMYQCGDSCNIHTEIYGWYAKGVYRNCTIITRGLDVFDVYENFSINDTLQGDIINEPPYTVHMTDVIRISNKTNKPIICDKFNCVRDTNEFFLYDNPFYYSTIHNTEGCYCHKNIRKYDYQYAHDMCNIRCCVDEYCAMYAQNIREYVYCACDESLNVTPSKTYICSNFKDDIINCS